MTQRPKQIDVARLAGVSRATVSYVLNEHLAKPVSIPAATRQRVLDAARQLGYQPNALARNLRAGASLNIGFLLPAVFNPYYWEVVSGAEEEITAHGYHLVLTISNVNPELELSCIHSLFQQHLDGLILMPTFLDLFPDEAEKLRERNIPAVFTINIDRADWVCPDVPQGAGQLMEHLVDLGHRRIALINGSPRFNLTQTREDAYRQGMAKAGLPIEEAWVVRCGHQAEDGYRAAQMLLDLKEPPTAIWAINDYLAMGVMRAVQERGLHIPEDVAVAGFDDVALSAQIYPSLTTVHMPSCDLGKQAAQALFKRLENPTLEPIQTVIPTHLVVRSSTVGQLALPKK